MNRAYSVLEIKSIDDDKRLIEGVATTPSPDRVGDVVEPMGAKFALPIPLLWQHRADMPVGTVHYAKRTKDGIPFKATIAKIEEAGTLKDLVDMAWQAVKAGLVRGTSIGFKPIERSYLDGGGVKFSIWEWLELSLVTIPMNSEATIASIKSFDAESLAASGRKSGGSVVRLSEPGAAGISKSTTLAAKEASDVKTILEQIAEWEAKRAAKAARQTEIMTKAAEAGRTLEAAEKEEHDTARDEIKEIDEHLVRLGDLQKSMQTKAKPVIGSDPEAAAQSRQPSIQVLEPKLDKGIGFARYIMCMAAAKGNPSTAERIAKQRFPNYAPLHSVLKGAVDFGGIDLSFLRKAAVGASATSDANSHTALVNYTDLAGEFLEWLRPQTIIGKFGTNGIPALTRVPFNLRVPRQTSEASAYWVGEGKPKPLTRFNTEQVTLDFHKVATICPLTKELVRFSNPSAETLVRNELTRAVVERIDIDFIDPGKAVSAGVSPASITNGATTVASSGDTAAAARVDIQALFSEFIQANMNMTGAVWIMNANNALALSMMMNELGQPEFPSITMNGGTFVGIPVIVSQYVPEGIVVLASAPDIYLADDGNVSIDASEEASLEMLDSALQQDGIAGTGASMVSMFQTNMVAIRAEREITWLKRRAQAVAYLTSTNWGGTPGSGDI